MESNRRLKIAYRAAYDRGKDSTVVSYEFCEIACEKNIGKSLLGLCVRIKIRKIARKERQIRMQSDSS